MRQFRSAALAAALLCCPGLTAAQAQAPAAPPPQGPGPWTQQVDPESWWTAGERRPTDLENPTARRRLGRKNNLVGRDPGHGVEPLLYRLWNLEPLQSMPLGRNEVVYEVWVRPTQNVRQVVSRVFVRSDGRTFLQARAGLGCCFAEVGRRVDINAELPRDLRREFVELAKDRLWSAPEHVVVRESDDAVSALCVDGVAYEVVLYSRSRVQHLRRSCAQEEVGSVAPVLRLVLGSAMGRDPRFDYALPRGLNIDRDAATYQSLLEAGGRLEAAAPGAGEAASAPPPPPSEEQLEAEELGAIDPEGEEPSPDPDPTETLPSDTPAGAPPTTP